MNILGIILIVVGAALILVGRNLGRHLPPDYREEDGDGFLTLLESMGNLLAKGGMIFCGAGLICILVALLS